MEGLNSEMKNKKVLFLLAAIGAVLVVVFFVVFLINKNNKPENSTAPFAAKEKSFEEVMQDLTAPVKEGDEAMPVSDEIINSLTAPINTGSAAAGKKNNKIVQPAPGPISKDIIDSLTAPSKE